ncbi:PREDICTED: autophagy protein 5 [Tarenaya hassleriana]|uniref:autophagy protein 5 n=1 Tax=Tarenaya hassleriana TaxID=28532 RepID=UPI00053C3DE4|nr:PREDICTED: autophagy protein 5 [Tarenaya hassleriana]
MMASEVAAKFVWEGAIPLQIHLHKSDVASHPAPPPALVLAPRIGYLPLLVPLIKPYFKDSLPPGEDSIWFDYKGLPLKWYIPTGVLFDLLCAEPERPWNLTIHFRGYPNSILIPCEGEESVKWSFINSLKEAAYIINGNCKNVMNMSQSDQVELWNSVMEGNLAGYTRISSKLKLGAIEDEFSRKMSLLSPKSGQGVPETDVAGQVKTARIPVRLYVRCINQDFDDLEDVPEIDSWDEISYLNRPVEFQHEEGKCLTLEDAIKTLLPEFHGERDETDEEKSHEAAEEENRDKSVEPPEFDKGTAEIKMVRIQGIEPKLEIPFSWVVNNLMNPEYYLHICVLVKAPPPPPLVSN